MIYFIRSEKAIKIGCSSSPRARLKQLQTACPDKLKLLGTIPGGAKEEAKLHRQFADYHLHREWFRASKELVQAINRLLGRERGVPSNIMADPRVYEEGRSWLRGLPMKHVPTGREFVCQGSEWGEPLPSGDYHLFIYTMKSEPEYDPPLTPEEEMWGIIPLHKVVEKPLRPGERVSALECILLEYV